MQIQDKTAINVNGKKNNCMINGIKERITTPAINPTTEKEIGLSRIRNNLSKPHPEIN
jgi:hypothetical protein